MKSLFARLTGLLLMVRGAIQDAMFVIGRDYDCTISVGNENLTNVIDFGLGESAWPPGGSLALPDAGNVGKMWIHVVATESFTTSGSPAATLTILASAAAALTSADTLFTVTFDETVVVGDILLSAQIPSFPIGKRYFGANLAVATAAFTAGTLDVWVSNAPLR